VRLETESNSAAGNPREGEKNRREVARWCLGGACETGDHTIHIGDYILFRSHLRAMSMTNVEFRALWKTRADADAAEAEADAADEGDALGGGGGGDSLDVDTDADGTPSRRDEDDGAPRPSSLCQGRVLYIDLDTKMLRYE
jgi:hypothetical protein